MRDEKPTPDDHTEVVERRSLDAVLQGAQAVGELTGGLGTLAIGVSKLKETFGNDNGPPPASEPPPSREPKRD